MIHKKIFLYLETKNAPNPPKAIIGMTKGSISNHKPNKPINASIKTDQIFIPITILSAVCKMITPLPTSASKSSDTALLLCKRLTNQIPVKIAFRFVFVILVTRC